MKKKILFINKTPFGYHTDYYKYCEYLKDEFNITYLCFDTNNPKLNIEDVNVKYISNKGNKTLRGIRFILYSIFKILTFKGVVFIHYFEHCNILKLILPWKKVILDIRTLSIHPQKEKREKHNQLIQKAAPLFNFVTIISEGLQKKIALKEDKSAILPLGADMISTQKKLFNKNLSLLYVGTLSGRNIHQTLIGLSLFLKKYKYLNKSIKYDIIGSGFNNELKQLETLIEQEDLQDVVTIHGRIPHFELTPFFDKCNIGVSYVPITDYYQYQPVTKTYEYILSGMACIATKTYENKQIINEKNGVLCSDTPESFAFALESLIKNTSNLNSEQIRDTLKDATWKNIVNNKLKPILNSF